MQDYSISLLFHSFSHHTGFYGFGSEIATQVAKALKENSVTSVSLCSNRLHPSLHSHSSIQINRFQEAIIIAEALKSNTSLTSQSLQ
jgi:hypothetical protein